MRIAILSSCSEPWGGSEELWFEAACALRSQGHSVEVLKACVDRRHPRIRELAARGCTVRDLHRWGPKLLWYAAASPIVAPIAVRLQLLGAGPPLLARRPRAAIVSQGGNFDGTTLALLCRRLSIRYVLVSQKASALHWPPDASMPHIRTAHEGARTTAFVSEENLALTRLQLDRDLPHATVIENPILAGRSGPLPWPANGRLRLACVGRNFVMEKGQDILLEVLSRPHWRDRDVELAIVGDGLNSGSIAGMARRLGLRNVTVQGYRPDREALWREHHALVLASRAEGMPLVVHEAMACGRVVVATDVGGTRNLVEDGVTGFLAADPGPEALDAALERAWLARDEWERIGGRGAARLREVMDRRRPAPLADVVLAAARP